jgi:AAA15 family ATPase/GTPase
MVTGKKQIERLQITSFRGATLPVVFEFQPHQSIALIFGENGSGKSSIADALDFICNNKFGSLELRKGTTPYHTHVVSSLGQPKDLEIEMVYGGETWDAKLQGVKPVTTPSSQPRAFILRRADITHIMEVNDGDRYNNLKEFITFPQIESAETSLRAAYKAAKDDVTISISQKDTAETTLQQFWEAEGKHNNDCLSWARGAIQQSIEELKTQLAKDKVLKNKYDEVIRIENELVLEEEKSTSNLLKQTTLLKKLEEASLKQTNADLVSTLQSAQTYLQEHPGTNYCPVCAKPEPYESLLSQITIQLTQLKNIQSILNQIEQNNITIQQAEGARSVANQKWQSAANELFELLFPAKTKLTNGFSKFPSSPTAEDYRQFIHELSANLQALEADIVNGDRTIAQHNAISTHIATIDELSQSLAMKHAFSQRLGAILAVIEQERKQHVQNTVDGISGTVSNLYARIHPDEPLGDPSFGMKPNTIGSLTMKGKFGENTDIPLVAYYSEAHLDTLGLCVYLALAKQSENAIVVLDDVLMSVDDPHLDRVIELINEEALNFGHVIITTHSRAWFDRVRLGKGMPAELIELYGWDLQSGIKHSHAPLAVNELRDVVAASKVDRQAIASRAGILLEQLLDELTLRYQSRLPRKQLPRYTLGELADCIDKNLQKLLRVEHLDDAGNITKSIDLISLIKAVTADSWIRNQVGAHFNPDAAGISDSMVRTFGENVLAFADAILCEHCHQLPRKNKSGSYWECGTGCGKIRLYPLAAPNHLPQVVNEPQG